MPRHSRLLPTPPCLSSLLRAHLSWQTVNHGSPVVKRGCVGASNHEAGVQAFEDVAPLDEREADFLLPAIFGKEAEDGSAGSECQELGWSGHAGAVQRDLEEWCLVWRGHGGGGLVMVVMLARGEVSMLLS